VSVGCSLDAAEDDEVARILGAGILEGEALLERHVRASARLKLDAVLPDEQGEGPVSTSTCWS